MGKPENCPDEIYEVILGFMIQEREPVSQENTNR